MFLQAMAAVFAHAAVPQKLVLVLLLAALPLILVAAAQARRGGGSPHWERLVSDARFAAPALGLLVGALNTFHMGQTIQRLPFDATAKQLAPGLLEVSTLVGLGALVGLLAAAAHLWLSLGRR